MEKPFSAYRGDGPYVFVCYAHEDSEAVFREIAWLNDYGVNVWYDEGISPGHEWREELAAAIQGCSRMLFFVSPRSVVSEHCRRELNFAQEEGREVIAVHLEPTEMPAGLRLGLNNRQAILKRELSEEEFHKRLMRAAQGAGSPADAPAPPSVVRAPRRKMGMALASLALVAVVTGVWWLLTRGVAPRDVEPAPVTEAEPVQEVLSNSIAVLPFANLSPDQDNAYFAAGIHEETLNHLAKIRDLSVIARTSVLQYEGARRPIREIASELKVQNVMEGSVRYSGNRVRITAQVIDADSGAHIWSEVYDGTLDDIFAVQSDIALKIAEAMKIEFSGSEKRAIEKSITDDVEAYAHYVRALSRVSRPIPDLEAIQSDLDAAIALDPGFAAALALKAYFYAAAAILIREEVPLTPEIQASNSALASRYADQALALDRDLASAYLARAIVDDIERRWDSGIANSKRALELNPNQTQVVWDYAYRLNRLGRVDEAIGLMDRAASLNPHDVNLLIYSAYQMIYSSRWEDAERFARQFLILAPDFFLPYSQLATIAAWSGDRATAIDMARETEARLANMKLALVYIHLLDVYARFGMKEDVGRMLDRLDELHEERPLDDGDWAFLYGSLGETDKAIHHLDAMVEKNFPNNLIVGLAHFPGSGYFDGVRDDPRFDEIRAKLFPPAASFVLEP